MDGRKKKVSTWAPEWLSRRPDKVRVSEARSRARGRSRSDPALSSPSIRVSSNLKGGGQQQDIDISLNTRVICSYRC
jgi:hypothetical protein